MTKISRDKLPDPDDERRPVYSDTGWFIGWFIIEGKAGVKVSRFEPDPNLSPYRSMQSKRKYRRT